MWRVVTMPMPMPMPLSMSMPVVVVMPGATENPGTQQVHGQADESHPQRLLVVDGCRE